ncbi:hypothetical protein [Pseudonocardia spirodelae]|uniref:DUF3168 domain-containing protein n=1 Tax=Pseudonocardia spirodelae TaxID=3133431 RepID=A0ABU8T7I5_9PSEU
MTPDPAERARDAVLLLLAADPDLAALGITFETVVALPGIGGSYDVTARPDADVLVLTWSRPPGGARQRVCLSVVRSPAGPPARAAAILRTAARALRAAATPLPGVTAIAVSAPHVQRAAGDGLVTTGFDVVGAA